MNQADFTTIDKFAIATIGYFIGTCVMGFIISHRDECAFPIGARVIIICGFAFGILATFT